MREILFKAKRKKDGKWVEGYFTKAKWYFDESEIFAILPTDLCIYPHCEFSEWIEVDENTICQYTGLTDKNGNKIWENDVVCVCVIDHAIAIYSEKHSGYILQPIEDYYFDSPMLVDNIDIINKVIGNIFDNPELLEGDQP